MDWRGDHYQVDSARLWDVPDVPVGIGVAVGGKKAIDKFGALADHLIAVEPDGDLALIWRGPVDDQFLRERVTPLIEGSS